jgi:CheY-like chemotaxis protein
MQPRDSFQPAPVPTRRVLIVDDNAGAAKVLALTLSKFWGHQVQTANAGVEALETAQSHRPELMLVDIGLPDISGYEVAQRLRARPEFAETLLVALTGYDDEADRRRSEQAGFDLHLVKPAAVATLQELFSHPKLASSSSP